MKILGRREGGRVNADELRRMQAPLKERYRAEPGAAIVKMRAVGQVMMDRVACRVETPRGPVDGGLHRAAGGDGTLACSGDMLLEALVACAGVTLSAVATATGIALDSARVEAEGEIDFRGTLGVAKDAPVGFKQISLRFTLKTNAPPERIVRLIQTTERYCVVLQTLRQSPSVHVDTLVEAV